MRIDGSEVAEAVEEEAVGVEAVAVDAVAVAEDVEDAVRDEVHQLRMRAYQSQSKSEYFNVKCVLSVCVLLYLCKSWA